MSKRCLGEPPSGAVPPVQPYIPHLDGCKRKPKEGRSMRACKILAKELAIRRPRIKLSAGPPARAPARPAPVSHQTPVPRSLMALPPPPPPLEIADIPLPSPCTTAICPSPAPAPSNAPSPPPPNHALPLRKTGRALDPRTNNSGTKKRGTQPGINRSPAVPPATPPTHRTSPIPAAG
ncbi:hypothetical protein JTB14_019743 [Gonioctena quinquepunctata]|nr:hypothetical protein JTB14_019743 [Gonioctena quinquepunctata]